MSLHKVITHCYMLVTCLQKSLLISTQHGVKYKNKSLESPTVRRNEGRWEILSKGQKHKPMKEKCYNFSENYGILFLRSAKRCRWLSDETLLLCIHVNQDFLIHRS